MLGISPEFLYTIYLSINSAVSFKHTEYQGFICYASVSFASRAFKKIKKLKIGGKFDRWCPRQDSNLWPQN